jgi:phage shock protein A
MTVSTPLEALRNLEQLYKRGFRDNITDAALLKVASSQVARDEAVLRDLERDLSELEQRNQMTSRDFFQRWTAGQMADTADFMDWNALYQMAQEVRERLELLRGQPAAE